jgi:hypothetical protein
VNTQTQAFRQAARTGRTRRSKARPTSTSSTEDLSADDGARLPRRDPRSRRVPANSRYNPEVSESGFNEIALNRDGRADNRTHCRNPVHAALERCTEAGHGNRIGALICRHPTNNPDRAPSSRDRRVSNVEPRRAVKVPSTVRQPRTRLSAGRLCSAARRPIDRDQPRTASCACRRVSRRHPARSNSWAAPSRAMARRASSTINGEFTGSIVIARSPCRHADECSEGLRQCMPQDSGDPPRKASFGTLAPALPQPPMVFVGWMLGMANGPMRAYTSFGTP